MPLLITHGWPGSFVEFTKVIGPLTDPAAHGGTRRRCVPRRDAVDSRLRLLRQAPREPGYDPARIAAMEAKLMARLGYTRYGVQGGDWGSIISTQLALADAPTRRRPAPEHVLRPPRLPAPIRMRAYPSASSSG